MTEFIEPCDPILRTDPPAGNQWAHEVKFDGYRVQLHKDGNRVAIYSRRGFLLTKRFRLIATALATLKAKSIILDGEAVVLDEHGAPSFRALYAGAEPIAYVFDVIMLNGQDLRKMPLSERRKRLVRALPKMTDIRISETFDDAEALLAECDRRGLEGIVSKKIDSPYRSGRSQAWIKVKTASWRAAHRDRYRLFEKPKRKKAPAPR